MTNNKKGFTLVEVIVVAVIVLVLSAVAIPMYNGFVRQARQDAVENLAETAAAAANTYWRKMGVGNYTASAGDFLPPNGVLNVYYDNTKYTLGVSNNGDSITVTDKNYSDIKAARPYRN